MSAAGEMAEWSKAPDSKSGVRLDCTAGSNPALSAGVPVRTTGEMPEWSKGHAWRACVAKATVGSNPTLSAERRGP